MRSTLIHVLSWAMLATFLTASFSSCKKEYDEPPVSSYPTLTANATIQSIIARHTLGQAASKIEDDIILEGIVSGDDKSGNIYKNIFIQDSTAGIQIRVDATSLYNNYPTGRKVWVKATGLYIGDYNGTPQISVEGGNAIPAPMVGNYIVGGERDLPVNPTVKTINSLSFADVNTLIKLEDVEFATASVGQSYANAAAGQSVSHNLKDCNGNTIVLRSSGYADFARELTPGGKGTVIALYTDFGTTKQLTIRDLTDITLTGDRCDGTSGGGGGTTITGPSMSIQDLRAAFTGSQMTAPTAVIEGVVISERISANVDAKTLYIQDGDFGVALRTSSAHSFNVGDRIKVGIGDDNMSEFNGLLQVYVNNQNMSLVSTGNTVTPRVITVNDLVNNLEQYEATLVRIDNATLSGSTFNGSRPLSDATGSSVYYTRSAAAFASTALPQGTVSVIGIASEFTSGAQLLPRTAADVIGGTTGGGTTPTPGASTLVSVADLRASYAGSNATISGKKIRGVVISDKPNKNIADANIVLQDGNTGIVIRFNNGSAHTFAVGDSIEVDVNGASLEMFNGLMQVNNAALTTVTRIQSGVSVTPRVVTVNDIINNFTTYESTLVTIQNATLTSGAGTYSGTATLNDGTANIDLYTRTQATFASTALPTSTVSVTGIVGIHTSGMQIQIRTTADVQ